MATVFIVRPFGTKTAGVDRDGTEIKVDFDAIDAALIQPALKENGLTGATTGVIAQAGNIRVDMFQMLIAYDLVIADISIDNANVFYELGIRHGLRPGGTILIRFSLPGKEVPFDLRTDRYVSYDRTEPAKAVSQLARAVRETVLAMSGGAGVDSPMFQLLPKLPVPDAKVLVIVPRDFQDSVEEAEKGPAHLGAATLATLAHEARNLPWGREGCGWWRGR